jgi:hypothetical protein
MLPINLKNAITRFEKVSASTDVQTLAPENGSRVGFMVYNYSTAAILYLAVDRDATTSEFTVKMRPGSFYEMPFEYFTAKVTGIWDVAEGYAQVTEISDR